MQELDVSTVVRVPPAEAYEFLLDFPNYAQYTDYLQEVRRNGDGDAGTTYDIVLSWWRISYTARSRVLDLDPPGRIDWMLEDALDASGAWVVEPLSAAAADAALPGEPTPASDGAGGDSENDGAGDDDAADDGADDTPSMADAPASRIRLQARFDGDSVGDANLGLPSFISTSGLLSKVAPIAKNEAKTIIERIVADLEGGPREVDVTVHERPAALK